MHTWTDADAAVVALTRELVAIPSESGSSNTVVCEHLQALLRQGGFEVEWLQYLDAAGQPKVSIVARKGRGRGGAGFFSHIDTVPGQPGEWEPWNPIVKDGKIYGRASCDMKGPLAATIVAAMRAKPLAKPVVIVITADEEVGFGGAKQVAAESQLLKGNWPDMGVIAEPTRLIPVRAHKGACQITVTARGVAAHTSMDTGISATMLLAPLLAEITEYARQFKKDRRFMDADFQPPTNGFNITINDGGCPANVTAAKTVAQFNFRTMPAVATAEVQDHICARAQAHGFEVETGGWDAVDTPRNAPVIRLGEQLTGLDAATVPYGTDALVFQAHVPLLILGPGNIAQAHTIGEWVEIEQLQRAVPIYEKFISAVCT